MADARARCTVAECPACGCPGAYVDKMIPRMVYCVRRGCRCYDDRVWDNKDEEPHVLNGDRVGVVRAWLKSRKDSTKVDL